MSLGIRRSHPLPRNDLLIIYDGKCGMCNSFISWADRVMRNSKDSSWLVSSVDKQSLLVLEISAEAVNRVEKLVDSTVVVIHGGRVYAKSAAIGMVLSKSDILLIRQLARLSRIMPIGWLLDMIYDSISSKRAYLSRFFRRGCQPRFMYLRRWPDDLEASDNGKSIDFPLP